MILIAVDGTGDFSNAEYDKVMCNSFCSQIVSQLGGQARYYRGPFAITAVTILRTWAGLADILKSGETVVYLAGYSRGAAAVTELAHYLRDILIEVEAMFLFDPVKREGGLPNAGTVPRNVKNCYQVLRTLDGAKGIIDSVTKFDYAKWGISPDGYQRRWMGRCSNKIENPSGTFVDYKVVNGSHGAAGGAPWYDYLPDRDATAEAATWMTSKLAKHRLPVTLSSDWETKNCKPTNNFNQIMGIRG